MKNILHKNLFHPTLPSIVRKLFIVLSVFCVFSAVSVFALDQYTTLAPLPGTTNCTDSQLNQINCITDFPTYLPKLFNLSIGIAAALAFIMISYGGFELMTTDSVYNKTDGRKKVENAIYGLLLVIGAYAILYTINPQILDFNLNINSPKYDDLPAGTTSDGTGTTATGSTGTGSGRGVKPGYIMDADMIADNLRIKNRLYNESNKNINPNSGPCTIGQTSKCTNLNGLPENAIIGLENLQANCNCSIIISGGTEGGHKEHGINIPIVDLRSDNAALNGFITGNATSIKTGNIGTLYTVNTNGVNATFLLESNPAHWHVTYR